MNVLKAPTKFITDLGNALRSETEQQRQVRAISAAIILLILVVIYYFFT